MHLIPALIERALVIPRELRIMPSEWILLRCGGHLPVPEAMLSEESCRCTKMRQIRRILGRFGEIGEVSYHRNPRLSTHRKTRQGKA